MSKASFITLKILLCILTRYMSSLEKYYPWCFLGWRIIPHLIMVFKKLLNQSGKPQQLT